KPWRTWSAPSASGSTRSCRWVGCCKLQAAAPASASRRTCREREMRKTSGMNRHQKAAHRAGEQRVGREEIEELLERSHSADPEERLTAARYLCPCHVRRRLQPVWDALYRLLEDADVRVRRAAWHTL